MVTPEGGWIETLAQMSQRFFKRWIRCDPSKKNQPGPAVSLLDTLEASTAHIWTFVDNSEAMCLL